MRSRHALAVSCLALLAGVGFARADGASSADLVRALAGEDAQQRYDAYAVLIAKRPPDALPLLSKGLPGMPIASQSLGFSIVQGYPTADSKPVLERWLSCDAPYLEVAAGATLLRAGDPKAAPTIVKALALPGLEPATLSMMLGQLYAVKDPKVVAAVRAHVRPDAPVEVLGAALYQLHSTADEGSRKAVVALLDATSAGVRAMAAAFLLSAGDEDKAEPLAAALTSGEVGYAEFVRVENLLARMSRCPEKVLDAVLTLLESEPKGYGLSVVIGLLGRFGYAKAAPTLSKLLDREDALLSKAAFEALSKIPGALTPDVTKGLLEGKDESRRVSAAEALRRADDLSGLAALIDVLKNGKTARADAARALGAFRRRAAVEPLIDALGDADLTVRAGAYNSLVTLFQTLFPYRRLDLASTGYATNAAPEVRTAAAARIRAWWDAHKDGNW